MSLIEEAEVTEKSFKPAVSSHGYGSAAVFFLSGHPSKDDILSGMALSGYQETALNSFLHAEKMNLKMCYRSCFIKEILDYNGNNPNKLKLALSKIDVKKYLDLLYDEIRNINPNIIVPLDDIALSAVFPHIDNLKKPKGRMYWVYCYRGSILKLRNDFQSTLPNIIRVIPTLGPQILNQDWTARSYTQIDFSRIKVNQNRRDPIEDVGRVWIAKDYRSFSNFLERGFEKNDGFVTNDVETYGGLITCMSFCFDGVEAVAVPLSPYYYPEINRVELALMWQLCAKITNNKIPKCGQNFKYDFTMLERHGMIVKNPIHDTMLKASLIYPELPKGLDFLTSIYTDIPYYKDEGKNFNPAKDSKDQLLLYCAKDSLATHIINREQDKELEESGMKNLYYNELAPLLIIYKDIDELGIKIDDEVKQKLIFKYTQMYDQNLSILRSLVGNESFNARSPTQVGNVVYEELRYPKRTKINENGIKSYKTDKDTLDDLLINFAEQNKLGSLGVKILNRIILCRKLSMVLVYLNTPLHPGGYFHGVSNLAGTETGRSSFSKSLDERFFSLEELLTRKLAKKQFKVSERLGRSLQTISKHGFKISKEDEDEEELFDDPESTEIASDLRAMFVPRRGFMFIEGDGSQAEARAVAVLAEDWELLASFDMKPKIHAKTAAMCFDLDATKITKDEPRSPKIGVAYYDLGKRIRHAGHYDMGEFRLAQMTHLALSDCKEILRKFHDGNPKIRGVYHQDVNNHVQKYHSLTTPLGRKRDFLGRLNNHLFKQAKAQIPQSTISDHTKFSMPRIIEALPGYYEKYRFLTEQHDGILAEVEINYWKEYSKVFKQVYERSIDFRNGSLSRDCQLVIPCELSKSEENWMNLKEFKI